MALTKAQIDLANELARLKIANKELLRILKKLLPMQGCRVCQDYAPCNFHGDIRETTKKAEQAIKKNKQLNK